MNLSTLLLSAFCAMSLPSIGEASEGAWTLEARIGMARTTRTITGLPSGVDLDASSAAAPYAGIGVWTSSLLPVELGSGLFVFSRGYESTERGSDYVIVYSGSEPYVSIPLLTRYGFGASGLFLIAGGAVDVHPFGAGEDARRRAILSAQVGVGLRLGRATFDARYVADVTDAVSLETDRGTIAESYDGFLVTLGFDLLSR